MTKGRKEREDDKRGDLDGTPPETQEILDRRGELIPDDLIIEQQESTVLDPADIKRIIAEREAAAAADNLKPRLKMPARWKDKTSERLGETITIIGAGRPRPAKL
jgi:hypothetical protein